MWAFSEQVDHISALLMNTMRLVFLEAFLRIAPICPSMQRDVHILGHSWGDLKRMSGAGFSAELPLTVRTSLIVKHKEVIIIPSRGIVADYRYEAIAIVILDCHEEYTIILSLICGSSLLPQCRRPFLAFITIGTTVGLLSPGVAQLD